jgi:hypothetical protein
MADYLASLPVDRVAAWYRRLANATGQRRVEGQEPYSAMLLRHWLDNRDPKSTFRLPARRYLQTNDKVREALRYHRAVFLTEQEARVGKGSLFGSNTRRGGVVPRIQGAPGFQRWDLTGKLQLDYQSLVEIGSGPLDILRIQSRGSQEEQDLFTSLRGFQLHSRALVSGQRQGSQVAIRFESWLCEAKDRYDWNYSEYLTVPNPDYGSKAQDAVRPTDMKLTVYHSNAKRLEDAKLAAPYDIRTQAWRVSDPTIVGPATVRA